MDKLIKKYLTALFFSSWFYRVLAIIAGLFALAFMLPGMFVFIRIVFWLFIAVVLLDYVILFFTRYQVMGSRLIPERFSNGDKNAVHIHLSSTFPFRTKLKIIDELPVQFQRRDFLITSSLDGNAETTLQYELRPVERGEYEFGQTHVFVKSPLGLVVRRFSKDEQQVVKVMPSFKDLRQFELLAYSNNLAEAGSRRIRKIGHSLEFEQIKEYVTGDDIRSINWKATARKGGNLMVNNYTDERSQQVYCLIDMGRVMKMPFEEMALLDYAINATLILSRVALIKQDKAGVLTFSDQINQFLPADRKSGQMATIMETLYNQSTKFGETDFEKVLIHMRTRITSRSLVILFTNFESLSGLERQLPYLRSISKNHLVLVVFFENTELKQITETEVTDVEGLYIRTIAEKFALEKRQMVKELQQHGIFTILTPPEKLTINTVNKYLELKARQAI
ncbi:MAG: DUF58 domain-containing protein [Chitinophagaceae bacterium]|nr:MAG: DUF58 domain-containing protein [Chitinophagaceae bacterium]